MHKLPYKFRYLHLQDERFARYNFLETRILYLTRVPLYNNKKWGHNIISVVEGRTQIFKLICNENIRVNYSNCYETTLIIMTHKYKYEIINNNNNNNTPISFNELLLCLHTLSSEISVQNQ
jgi:hypothetical protein